jgi:hypothetical protein
MRIAIEPLYDLHMSVVHIEPAGGSPWTFVPFDDDKVLTIEPLGENHLLVLGDRTRLAIWRLSDRTRTVLTHVAGRYASFVGRTLAVDRRSIFLDQNKSDNSGSIIREICLDGTYDHDISIPLIQGRSITAVNGGERIVVAGHTYIDRQRRFCFLQFDPDSGEARHSFLPQGLQVTTREESFTVPQSFSPNGELAARPHLGSLAHAPAGRLTRYLAAGHTEWGNHPDLSPLLNQDCYGIALDVYETGTGRLRTRLLAAFISSAAFDQCTKESGWTPEGQLGYLASSIRGSSNADLTLDGRENLRNWGKPDKPFFQSILERMAERHPYHLWDGSRQIVFTEEGSDDLANRQQELISFPFRFLLKLKVQWHSDGQAFTVSLPHGMTREVALDGRLGPLRTSELAKKPYIVPAAEVRKLRSEYKSRHATVIKLSGFELSACVVALEDMAHRMECGLQELLYRDILDWRFTRGEDAFDEADFFRQLRTFAPSEQKSFVAPLRRILKSYGEQSLVLRPSHKEQFIAGVGSDEEESWTAALSDAAQYLAEVDFDAGTYLRSWLVAIDQEHDQVASERIVPAVASFTSFKTEVALRFGLFYLIQQWQTPSIAFDRLGIIHAAWTWCSAEQFASIVQEEAEAVANYRSVPADNISIDNVTSLLDASGVWDRRVAILLDCVIDTKAD